jgi:putative ABC transport system substrate-binding protein
VQDAVAASRTLDDAGMDRRRFLLTSLGGVVAAPFATEAQQNVKTYRVVYIELGSDTAERKPHLQVFRAAMRGLGYVEGKNLTFDARFAENAPGRLSALADEVITLNPDVLLAFEPVAQVLRTKTISIPIVLLGGVDPILAGLAKSLARPGLNITGSTQLLGDLAVKHVEILRQILPRLVRVGQLVDTTAPACKAVAEKVGQAARGFGAIFVPYDVANGDDIKRAFQHMQKQPVDALVPCPSPILFSFRDVLFDNVLRLRIPLTSFVQPQVPFGVLFSYAATVEEGFHRAATYVDKILKGAKPGDLPIEQPSRFRFVINLKTAKALGLTIPPSLLARADQVIE